MKKFLQFAGLISLGLALVGFILMMATHALEYSNGSVKGWYSGTAVIFANGRCLAGLGGLSMEADFSGKLAVTALLGWIFALVAMIIILLGVILPLLKINALEKFAGLLNLIAVCLLVIAGVFVFITVPVFAAANEWNSSKDWLLGVGWVFAGIFYIAAGVIAIMPAAANFMAKSKKR